jgi:ligand-binding sensor domain-containing protein
VVAGNTLYAGTNGGVFKSTDDGNNWSAVNTGLSNTSIRALAVDGNNTLYAGTDGGGVFTDKI